jgi:catechol 2,3-dioxygenase-like lactoylglutathione lyase family enzyme
MFDHVGISIGRADVSIPFFEACLAPLGIRIIERQPEHEAVIFAGRNEFPFLWIGVGDGIFHGTRVEVGKCPMHLAFVAPSKEAVDEFHRIGLLFGGRDNGAPEDCGRGYYAAYLLDPDGNNIEAGVHLK